MKVEHCDARLAEIDSVARGRLNRSEKVIRILTNQTRKGHPFLLQRAHLLHGWDRVIAEGKDAGGWRLRHFLWSWRLFRESRDYDAVVTGWDRPSLLFAVLQGLFRRRPKCHVVIYTKWRMPDSRVKRWLRMCEYRLLSRLVDRYVPLSERQAEMNVRMWHIPREKFAVVPYHTTMDEPGITASEGDYIFAGGDDEKDYRTLLSAIDGLDARVVIAARQRHHFEGLTVPPNVEILSASRRHFFELMAGAKVVMVPLLKGAVRGGEQTFLNAMLLGKPVIVLSDCGAGEYIIDGEQGIVLSCGDVAGLRDALLRILHDDVFRNRLAEAGKAAAEVLTPKRYCDRLMQVVTECLTSRSH